LVNNPNNIAKIVGSGNKAMLILDSKDASTSERFSGFGGSKDLTIKIRATQIGDASYHPALPVERQIKIKAPSRVAFYDERRMDSRFDDKKNAFLNKLSSQRGITGEKAIRLFDSDNYDSDGDGMSNLMERAFGGDSLFKDKRSVGPKSIRKGDGYQYLIFNKFNDTFNTEGIVYIVESSRDLRTWTPHTDSSNGPVQVGTALDLGGGMERVVFRTREKLSDNNGKSLYMRVRVKAR
tara:strand:+ start:575 stop:1285 length:711 start_codon:yes stop_codon:yes gene_type:complete